MPRTVACFAGIVLFSVSGFAQQSQPLRSSDPGASQARKSDPPLSEMVAPAPQLPEHAVSVARLRVPREAQGFYEKARKAFRKNRYAEAEHRLGQALQAYPAFPEALTMLGYIQLSLDEWEPAEQSLRAAVRTDPNFGLAHIVLAFLYNTEHRFDDAAASARRAGELAPDSWVVQFEMTRALLGKGQYDSALSVSDAALHKNRGTLLHVVKAQALMGLKRFREASTELQTYLQYQPAGELAQHAHDLLKEIQSASPQ